MTPIELPGLFDPAATASIRRQGHTPEILATGAVPDAMMAAFQLDSAAPLPNRLLRGLEAGLEAGGEKGAVRSADLLVAHVQSFPYVDLRVDLADAPSAALRELWEAYAPQADDFVARAVDPGLLGPSQA